MDRWRAAGALLALAACIACSAAAPTASNHTALDLYEGASEGCYYNFQHYGEGDRIMTNEPCLNCTCHNRMLMCYLRVCPFTKPIGQDCTVEKRADQCCPIVTCPDVPVDLLTSTSTTSPAEYGATGLGKLDKYGCSINGKYFPEGSKVPPTPNKPCEHCYCIRNMTTCVMQECTLHVDGCTPIYHKDVCCPVRYSCDHPEDEMPLLDDMSTTVRPTPGFLLTTTTVSPVTQMTQDCVHNDRVIADGASITTEKACEHCYCMKGDIVCVVQECGAPMENEGKNCTSLPPREGQCCPDTYICEGDELSTEISTESATDAILDKLTTLSPPRRGGEEGSGYRHEASDGGYTEIPTAETELEGSGEEEEPTKTTDSYEPLLPGKPVETDNMTPALEDGDQYIPVTTKAPTFEEPETTTKELDRISSPDTDLEQETVEPETYKPTTHTPLEESEDKITTGITEDKDIKSHEHETSTSAPDSYEKSTPELGESLSTVSDLVTAQEYDKDHSDTIATTSAPSIEESRTTTSEEKEGTKGVPSDVESEVTPVTPISEEIPVSEYVTPGTAIPDYIKKETTEKSEVEHEHVTEKESSATESYIDSTTRGSQIEEEAPVTPKDSEEVTFADILKEKDTAKPEYVSSTTSSPAEEMEKLTTEPDHALNTVAVAEEGFIYPHGPDSGETEKTPDTDLEDGVTESFTKDDTHDYHERTTPSPVSAESDMFTAEPDKGLNTIPSETDEESSSQPSLVDKTTSSLETKSTEPSIITHVTEPQDVDLKSSTPESLMPSEMHVTKGDQYTITTEPSFRREDDVRATTEKSKEESLATTIKPEFVDEGLIPTSTHDEKPSTGSDVSNIDEEITTMLPEYSHGLEETLDTKHPTTESSTPVISETTSDKIMDTVSEEGDDLPSSTEKPVDITAVTDADTHEEPSRIPGEGDCLLNGVTYRNNTVVPSSNNCHTGCKCVSSIIKCDPIICSPPPDYMDNCQSIYDTPDSCCPTYVCDHRKETSPPQSDNQMSGTEAPMPPPVIECHGDQCELSQPTVGPTGQSEPCISGNCEPTPDHKPEAQCGPEGCESAAKEPEHSIEEPSCKDGKCEPTHESQPSPVKPCEGDTCKSEDIPSPQLCDSENDCKKEQIPIVQTIPCEGDSCTNVDCRSGGCIPDAVTSPQDTQPEPCTGEDGCKTQEILPSDCTGDAPCRRKETPTVDLPSKCEGSDCISKPDTTSDEQIPLEGVTEKVTPIEEEKISEPMDGQMQEQEKLDTTPSSQFATEKEQVPTVQPTAEITSPEEKIDEVTQKTLDMQDISTDEPSLIDEEDTKKPIQTEEQGTEQTVEDQPTEKPVTHEDDLTKTPEEQTDKQHMQTETSSPDIIEEEHTDKPGLIEKEDEKVPDIEGEEQTGKPSVIEEDGTKAPDVVEEEQSAKPDLDIDGVTKTPEIPEEEQTGKPALVEEEGTKTPDDDFEKQTDKPLVEDEGAKITEGAAEEHTDKSVKPEDQGTKVPDVSEEDTKQPPMVDEIATKLPDIIPGEQPDEPSVVDEEQTDKPVLDEKVTKTPEIKKEEPTAKPEIIEEEFTKVPDTVKYEHTDKIEPTEEEDGSKMTDMAEGYTGEPAIVEEATTKIADVIREETTGKPTLIEEGMKTPDITVEPHTDESMPTKEEDTKITDVAEGYTDEPSLFEETGTKLPAIIGDEDADKLSTVKETVTTIPDIEEKEPTGKPDLVEDQDNKIPDVVTAEHTDKPSFVEEEVTEIPDMIVEKQTEKSVPAEEDGTKLPETSDGYTDEPISEDMITKSPDTDMEYTSQPAIIESDAKKPDDEKQTSKPTLPEEVGTKIPDVISEDQTEKITSVEEQDTKIPDVAEEHTDKPDLVDEERTVLPDVPAEEHTPKSVAPEEEGAIVTAIPVDEHKPDLEDGQALPKPDDHTEHSGKPSSSEDVIPDTEDVSKPKPESGEQSTETPISVGDEYTMVPDNVIDTQDQVKEKPIQEDQEPEKKPGVVEEDGITEHSMTDVESTGMPEIGEESDSKKPIIIDESTLAPAEIEYSTQPKLPIGIEETATDKSTVPGDETSHDKPSVTEESTKKPTEDALEKEHTDIPEMPESTEAPKTTEDLYVPQPPKDEGTRRTESEMGDKLPETSPEDHAEAIEKETKSPIDESQTIAPTDTEKSEETIPSVPQETDTSVPELQTPEVGTQSYTEQERTTMLPLSEPVSEDGLQEPYQTPEHVTSQEPLTNAHEETKVPEYIASTESVEKATKSTDHSITTEKVELYTDMPEQEPSITKSPEIVDIEPQDGDKPTSSDATEKGPVDEESATTVYEKDIFTPSIPESHVTHTVPESGVTSMITEPENVQITEAPMAIETETQKEELLKPQDTESDKTPTKSSQDVDEPSEIKTDQPEIFTPEKEEMITSTIVSAVTEPSKGFTEIEDAFVTGQYDITTESHGEPIETSATEKSSESSDTSTPETPLSDTKGTTIVEGPYTEVQEPQTEAPVLKETQSADDHGPHKPESTTDLSIDEPTATEPSQLPEKTPELDTVTEKQDVSTLEAETKSPDTSDLAATGLPVPVEIDSQEKPIDEVTVEKTTKMPESEASTVSDKYAGEEQTATVEPVSHISPSEETEQTKQTETPYPEEHVDVDKETDMKSEEQKPTDTQQTTLSPERQGQPADTEAPELSLTESPKPSIEEQPEDVQKSSTEYPAIIDESHTEVPYPQASTEGSLSLVTEQQPATAAEDTVTEKHDTEAPIHETHSDKPDIITVLPEMTTTKEIEDITKAADQTPSQVEFSETTPYLIELEEHTHKVEDISTTSHADEDIATPSSADEDHTQKAVPEVTTVALSEDEQTYKTQEHPSTSVPFIDSTHKTEEDSSTVSHAGADFTTAQPESESHSPETYTEKIKEEETETGTKQASESSDEVTTSAPASYQTTLPSMLPEETTEKQAESAGPTEQTHIEEAASTTAQDNIDVSHKEYTTAKSVQEVEGTTPAIVVDTEKVPVTEPEIAVSTEKETSATQKPLHPDTHIASTVPEDEPILSTTKATTIKQEELITPAHEDKYEKPDEKPTSEIVPPSTTPEIPKPPAEMQPTDEVSPPEDDGHFPPSGTGYGEPDYVEEDQAFGPGTCRYGGKVYVSAQQIPRDDPCDFCFCFRSDIICLQQSCPPPIHGCHEEPIQGFCCPRYECPVSMATTVNVTTTTTTTTTTLPPHFPTHSYKGAAQRRGCQIKGHTYKVGEVVRSSSGPCLHCTCGGDGQMKCDPKACTPEPMLRQMIAAAVSAKRRR